MTVPRLSRPRARLGWSAAIMLVALGVASMLFIGARQRRHEAATVDSALTRLIAPAPRRQPVSLRVQP
jgi:hypothetical protein